MIILFAYPLFLKYDGVSIQKGPVHIVGMSLFLETKNLGTLQTLGNILAPMKIFFGGGAWRRLLDPYLLHIMWSTSSTT